MSNATTVPEGRKPCPKCKGSGHIKDKSWSGAGVRQKGQRGEREVVKLLQPIVDKVCLLSGREPVVLQRNALQAHLGGEDIHGLEGFSVEVKFCENEQLSQWWSQALRQAAKRQAVPVLFFRCSGSPWTVRFRAYVSTPRGFHQRELDLTVPVASFLPWFEDAYSEHLRNLAPVNETPVPAKGSACIECTCVSSPGMHCKYCHH